MIKRQHKKKIKRMANLPFRLNALFFAVALLFSILLFRLVQMQLVNYNFYHKKLTASTTYTVKTANQRGQIYDANGTALVSNVEKNVLTLKKLATREQFENLTVEQAAEKILSEK